MQKALPVSCFFILLSLLTMDCRQKPSTHPAEVVNTNKDSSLLNYKKPGSGFKDTLYLQYKSALFFDADPIQLGKIKSKMPDMNYQSDVHDCFFQMRNTRNILKKDWPDIKIVEAQRVRYLGFTSPTGQTSFIDLDGYNQMCGIILYDPAKKPQLVDMMNIDTELSFYFR